MHDDENNATNPTDEALPLLGLIVKLQIGAQVFFLALLFAAVTTSSLYNLLLGGFLGMDAVLVHSILLAFIAVIRP